jgi:acetyl esterase
MTNQFDSAGPDMESIQDFDIQGSGGPIPVRLYEPFGASKSPGPALIYLHGGGFVTCSVESHDGLCRRIASGSGYRVLSVEYRLAPQHPFPAGLDDCETVLKWALSGSGKDYGLDPARLALGGDSAGGNMTAYLSQIYRSELKAQILYYPLMQLIELKPPNPGPQDVLQLGVIALKFIEEHYVAGADVHDTRLSPLLEKNLSGLPPTQVLTCGLDPLRMEGRAYAENLQAAGVTVEAVHEKLLPHGYLNFSRAFPKAKKTPLSTADFLREHLGG